MAKTQQNVPVVPSFKDLDKEATQRAHAALQGGRQEPLKVPVSAKVSTDDKGVEYRRWSERVQVTAAYRTVTKTKLMDATVIVKIRQSKENSGSRAFGHFYLNMAAEKPEGHEQMNDRSNGAIISLLSAVGLMPKSGGLKGSLLDRMFPSKGQPGTASPLVGKLVVANLVQTLGPQKNTKTNKPILDDDGEPILGKRDQVESFLPDAPAEEGEEPEEGEEDNG